jgi:hypothetical protein
MRMAMRIDSLKRALALVALLPVLNCGSENSSEQSSEGTTLGGGGETTMESPGSSGTGTTPLVVPEDYIGLWSVKGTDSRGPYVGQVEIRKSATGLLFLRTVHYPGAQVEDARELHVAWTGSATRTGGKTLSATATLDPRGFILQRGAVRHALADLPQAVSVRVAIESDVVNAHYTLPGKTWTEQWESPLPSPAEPLLRVSRTNRPAHDPPSTLFRTTAQSQFASYRALPEVAPYAARTEFKAAVHFIVEDTTDFDFYQKNHDAIRVWNKPIDAISIQEAKLRADAFRWTLATKAANFSKDLETRFIDATGMVTEGGPDSGPMLPSNDGALWTAGYMAAEAYRYQVTGDPVALVHARRQFDAILKLQEVTGNRAQFARTLRVAGSGAASDRWHPGTGTLGGLEWRSTGNNDMLKGVLYGQILGYQLFCKTGNDPICNRLRSNAKHVADDINVALGGDDLYGLWIAAITSDNVVERAKYRAKAESTWATKKVGIRIAPSLYEQGIADWSGLHLNFISNTVALLMAEELNLGGDAKSIYRDVIRKSYANVKGLRLPMWELLAQAFGEPKDLTATSEAQAILRELPFPKPQANINHNVNPSFCVSPYPRNAWKNDWLTSDRVRAIHSYPYYEVPADDYYWKEHMEFDGDTTGHALPGTDYVHLYWFARKHGVLSGTE